MRSNPRTSANLLVILVRTPVNLLVKPTESGQGGAIGARGLPEYGRLVDSTSLVGLQSAVSQLVDEGCVETGLALLAKEEAPGEEKNGYPFTTFSRSFPTFLG